MAAGYPHGVPLTDLVRRAGESDGVDLVYVDDNYGYFRRSFLLWSDPRSMAHGPIW